MYQRATSALWRRVSDSCIVLCDGLVHELAGGAAAFWMALEEPRSTAELIQLATGDGNVSTKEASLQVDTAAAGLVDAGLVSHQ
jgi:hypothetical protein